MVRGGLNRQAAGCDKASDPLGVRQSDRFGNISFRFGTIFGGLDMNRVIVSGVALFFATVGIALLGGQEQAAIVVALAACCGRAVAVAEAACLLAVALVTATTAVVP